MEKGIIGLLEDVKAIVPSVPDLRTYSPLTLAYIGDAVYDLLIRTRVVLEANCSPNRLHGKTVKFVRAKAQANAIDHMIDSLSEEERAVYKRGFNANPHTVSKNADHIDYLKATGFEALLGYLYLQDKLDRLTEIVSLSIQLNL